MLDVTTTPGWSVINAAINDAGNDTIRAARAVRDQLAATSKIECPDGAFLRIARGVATDRDPEVNGADMDLFDALHDLHVADLAALHTVVSDLANRFIVSGRVYS